MHRVERDVEHMLLRRKAVNVGPNKQGNRPSISTRRSIYMFRNTRLT